MADIFTKDQKMNISHARLGGYVEDQSQHLYGITCQHVTQIAHEGLIYIKDENGDFIKFGHTLQKQKEYEIKRDIDMFMINDDMVSYCDKTQRNFEGKTCTVKIYDGKMSSIYCQKIFMRLTPSSTNNTSPNVVCSHIASAEIHREHDIDDSWDTSEDAIFLVDTTEHIKPGESGNLIFMENFDSSIYILGIVVGGIKEYVLCLRFDFGKKLLEDKYNIILRLPKCCTKLRTVSAQKKRNVHLPVGSCIWVSPENVKKGDFVLFEHVLMLVEIMEYKESSATDIKDETELNYLVNSRSTNLYEITYETSDQRCLHECMKGCDNIYSGNFSNSEEHFKDAVRLILKTSCRNRLLCQLITYVTWHLLDYGELDKMKKLLLGCEKYILKMKDCDACSFKYLGYFYHDFSRFYFASGNYNDALRMARQSLNYFKLGEEQQDCVMHEKSFALCMIANANLLCGEKFENRHMPASDIKEAQDCVDEMRLFVKDLPVVEKTCYLLVKTDLHFRKGEIEKALKYAKKSYDLASKNKIKRETAEAYVRIRELK